MNFNIYFFPSLLFYHEWGLGLIGHPLVFNGYRFLQRIQFSFHQNYICYLEYFQEGNGLLGAVICWCFLVEILNYNVTLKNLFCSLKRMGLTVSKHKYIRQDHSCAQINFFFPFHVEKSYRQLYSRNELNFGNQETTFYLFTVLFAFYWKKNSL